MPSEPSTIAPLRRDARANRDRILAAARISFAAGGIDVPVEEIAKRAGVGMGTLYRRFPTKEDLIDAVLEDSFDAFAAAAERSLEEDDPWAGFSGFVERTMELHAENRALKDVLATGEHGRERLEAARERLRPLLRKLIERAQASGDLRPDFTPRGPAARLLDRRPRHRGFVRHRARALAPLPRDPARRPARRCGVTSPSPPAHAGAAQAPPRGGAAVSTPREHDLATGSQRKG